MFLSFDLTLDLVSSQQTGSGRNPAPMLPTRYETADGQVGDELVKMVARLAARQREEKE